MCFRLALCALVLDAKVSEFPLHIYKMNWLLIICLFFFLLLSLSDLGADSHAGGAGDLLRAAAAKAAEEDVLPEEREAEGPPRHFGT